MITLNNGVLEVSILKRGVTFIAFKHLKDNVNIITSFENLEDYHENNPYLGALIGPLAGRTEPNQYGLNLDINNPPNHLHGGKEGLSFQHFDVIQTKSSAVFSLTHDEVDYTINIKLDSNNLIIIMKATPYIKRPINLTNHMYFNLDNSLSLNNHKIKLRADKVSYLNENMVNNNYFVDVKKSVFDLNEEKTISELLNMNHPQFKITRHLDHSFLGNEVSLTSNKKTLSVRSTMSIMHLYLSNYFDESFKVEGDRWAQNHMSLAIEPQYLPNNPYLKLATKENPFFETIVYTLSIIDD